MGGAPTSMERMESRVAELELQLGSGGGIGAVAGAVVVDADVSSRLDALMRSVRSSLTSVPPGGGGGGGRMRTDENAKRTALHEDFVVIHRLLRELDVSSIAGPTASVAVAAGGSAIGDDGPIGGGVVDPMMTPVAYRRMEVLANAESMRRDLRVVSQIRDLVTIGTRTTTAPDGSSSSLSSSMVVNCPIVSSGRYDLPSDPDVIDRLNRLCYRIASLSGRVVDATRRADDMLNSYGRIVMALSEKMVLAEEQVNDK